MNQTLTSIARIARTPEGLGSIRDDDCSLAIWERESFPEVAALLPISAREVRFEASLADLEPKLCAAMREAGFAMDAGGADLVDDIGELAAHYCAILQLDRFELRLEIVTTDACRKFHADYVTARLITTYVGDGTQWLDAEDAERLAAGDEPQCIRKLAAGDVGLFKGKLATSTPAVHRSPPIGENDQRRLLLVLNPPLNSSEPAARSA